MPCSRYSLRRAAAAGAVLALLAPVGASAAPRGGACSTVRPEAGPVPADAPGLSVTIKADRSAYRRGEVARLPVTVSVAAPGGPRVAGADVEVTISSYGRPVRTLNTRTGADGTSVSPLKITRGVPLGPLSAKVTAKSILVPGTDCAPGLVYLVGEAAADPLLTVR